VRPTITRYWEEKIANANVLAELSTLQAELRNYKVLDSACGSGNFLYMAYLELKRLERVLQDKIDTRRTSERGQGQMSIGFVTPQQFYGMDTNAFAVELARVTLMIARKVAIDLCDIHDQPALPLDTLDANIVCKDALFTEWVKADAIIGNPPFLGGKNMRMDLSDDYIDRVFKRFPDVKDSVDFCAYWFRLAHDCIGEHGRAGLVGTNSISQGKSRTAALDYITQNNGYIYDAISTQVWSGEAKVHVSIVNWSKEKPHIYYLDNSVVLTINSSLQPTIDVSATPRLLANLNKCFQGVIPVGKGFFTTEQQAQKWIQADPRNKDVLKLSSSAGDLTDQPQGFPTRWIIDFNDLDIEEASNYLLPFEQIRDLVKPERSENRRAVTKINWWKFGEKRPAMRKALEKLPFYLSVPSHSKWFIFLPTPIDWLANNSINVIASEDFYILGILTSNVH